MRKSALNILLDSSNNLFDERSFFDWPGMTFVKAHNIDHLMKILNSLPLTAQVLIWIHLDGRRNSALPPGVTQAIKLRRKLPNLRKIVFVTAGYPTNTYSGLKDSDRFFNYSHAVEEAEKEAPMLVQEVLRPIPGGRLSFEYLSDKYNWRTSVLKENIDETILSELLYSALKNDFDQYIVENLKPGYSDAFVLKVTCITQNHDKERSYLFKISKNSTEIIAEYEAAKHFRYEDFNNQVFVGVSPIGDLIELEGYYCLVYPFKSGTQTLRDYLEIGLKDASLPWLDVLSNLLTLIDQFQNTGQVLLCKNLHPFRPGIFQRNKEEFKYSGLSLGVKHKIAILAEIELFEEQFLNANKDQFNIPLANDLEMLKNFVYDNEDYVFTQKHQDKSNETLVAISHGDFHTRNILIESETLNLSIIDFANATRLPVAHAMLDLGKLSSDLEISVFPKWELFDNANILGEWIEIHQTWMKCNDHVHQKHNILDNLYNMNSAIRNHLLKRYKHYGLSQPEIIRQFYMVRLHYFLKMLGYGTMIREKKLFCLHAVIDILKFLKGE